MGSFQNEGPEHIVLNSPVPNCVASSCNSGGKVGHSQLNSTSGSSLSEWTGAESFQSEDDHNTATVITTSEPTAHPIHHGVSSNGFSLGPPAPTENMAMDGLEYGAASNIMDEFAQDWALPFETEHLIEDDTCLGNILNNVLDESIGWGSVPV